MSGTNEHDKAPRRSSLVQSVDRALAALEAIGKAAPEGLALSDLAAELSMSRSAAWAILRTLMARGFIAETSSGYGRTYVLGLSLARLGDQALSQISIREITMPYLHDLTEATGLTSRLAVLHDAGAIVMGRVDAPGAVRFNLHFGQPELLHCSAVGKSLLSSLPNDQARTLVEQQGLTRRTSHTITDIDDLLRDLATIRARGYSVDDEEDAEGIICIGACLYDLRRSGVGAISVTGLKQGLPTWRVDEIGRLVVEHAASITAKLGGAFPSHGEDHT